MSGLKVVRLFFFFLLLLQVQEVAYTQENEEELKAGAEKLFENEKYVEATPLYLRLLALNPRSYDYNFRYGTCLLFNSYKKQDALRYLNYSISDPAINPQAYYFLGKAYHLNYQFNEAIRNYELYKQKAGTKIKPALELDRSIEMCQNGKRLLTTITDLVVLERKEIEIKDFFRLYNLTNIGGDIVVAAAYQSKLDKKKGHVPLIYFPVDASVMYYASYGETDTGSKDIYMRRKLPDGTWGAPQAVTGNVNTQYDEDFPYMHPGGEYLYFSSKGHNSMGGYDIFRSKLNPENNSFDPPENMNFAISSPDNDLFYVVDSLNNNAYFASARQSANGKMHIYKVRVERVPLQLAVIKGSFSSTINPDNKKLSITVTDYASGEKIGTFASSEQGNFLITLPKGGKYTYEMKVGGKTAAHTCQVTIPVSKDFRPLKQEIMEETADSREVVRVIDLFNEEVDDPAGILAEVIKQRSELNPNAARYDLKRLDANKENQKILAGLGFEDAGPQEIAAQFDKLDDQQHERLQSSENSMNGALTSALDKLAEAEKLQERAKTLVNKANSSETKKEKLAVFTEAQETINKATGLKKEAKELLGFADSVSKVLPAQKELLAAIETVTQQVKTAVADDNAGDLKDLITKNAAAITAASAKEDPLDALIEERSRLKKEQAKMTAEKDNYDKTAQQLEQEIKTLTASLPEAKKKDQPGIQSSIDAKTQELSLVREDNDRLARKVSAQEVRQNAVDEKIAFLQNITQVRSSSPVAPNTVQARIATIDTKNSNTLTAYIHQQVAELKKDPALAADKDPGTASEISGLEEKQATALNSISEASGLTPKEKASRLLKADLDFIDQLAAAMDETTTALEKDPADQKAIERRKGLTALQKRTEARVEARKQEMAALPQDPEVGKSTLESELAALSPDYREELKAAAGADPRAALESENAVDNKLADRIDDELAKVENALAKDPSDQKAQERKASLTELKARTERQISDREAELTAANNTASAATPEQELALLNPAYNEELDAAASSDPKATLNAENAIDTELIARIDDALGKVERTLKATPGDQQAQERKTALTVLKTRTEEQIEDRKTALFGLEQTSAAVPITPENELKNLAPDYENEMAAISGQDRKTQLQQENAVDSRLAEAIASELEEVESQLGRNAENTEAKERKAALQELQGRTDARISERINTIEALSGTVTGERNAMDLVAESVRPEYRANKEAIKASTQPGAERESALLGEDKALLEAIDQAVEKTDAQVLKNPENTGLQDKLEALKVAQTLQEATVSERELDLIALEQAKIDPQVLQAQLAPSYRSFDPENPAGYSEAEQQELIAGEVKLQQALLKRQSSNEKQIRKSGDTRLIAENKVIQSLLDASQELLQQLKEPAVIAPDAIALIRNDLGDESDLLLNSDPATVEQAKRIITELKDYEEKLSGQLKVLQEENPVNEAELAQKKSQLVHVRKRIGTVEADLDAMQNFAVAEIPESSRDRELEQLTTEENALKERIASGNLSSSGKRTAEKELKTVQARKAEGEQVILKEKVAGAEAALASVKTELEADRSNPAVAAVLERAGPSGASGLEKKPATAVLKAQLQEKEESLSLLSAAAGFAAMESAFKQDGVVVETVPALNARKRRFAIEIGQLESELAAIEKDPAQAAEADRLRSQQAALQTAVATIDDMVTATQTSEQVTNPLKKGLETSVSYEEEVALAGTPAYAALTKQNKGVKAAQRELSEINREKEGLRKAIAATGTPEKRASLTGELVELNNKSGNLQQQLVQQQNALEASIAQTGDPEKVRNLLARDVAPVTPVPLAAVVAPELKKDFEIVANPTAVRTEIAIPVDLRMPEGLVYRVQVGAFAKPIPEELFKEFTPVSGEKLNNGITRYLAGYFGSRQRVINAQKSIRALGYSDAFVVAYCDGERISLAEARRLEDAGLCVPKNQDSLLLQVAESRLAQLSPDSLARLRPPVRQSDYNKAPGAVAAEAVEERKGLFFTVQVGVYNRPATAEQLRGIAPLVTKRLENGQIRYSTGIFQTPEAAKPKRIEAITRGIADAFVTAYYKGERISLSEAKRLLDEQGQSILEPEGITPLPPTLLEEARAYTAAQPVKVNKDRQPVQIVSTEQYATYPSEQLNRYNAYGTFYYDTEDKHIKSIVYPSVDALPQLKFLQESVDTVFRGNEIGTTFELKLPTIVALWDAPEMDGALADWLLRLTIPHQGSKVAAGYRISFEDVPAEKREELMQELRNFGARSVTAQE